MTQLHVSEFGTGGTPLVLLGSLGSRVEMWLPQLDYFAASRRTIALDLRGHGESEVVPGSPTIVDFAQDVLDTLDSIGVIEFDLVGLSMGGAIAQQIALSTNLVRRLILVSTAPKFGTKQSWLDKADSVRAGGLDQLSETVISRWFSPSWIAEHPASLEHWRRMITDTPTEGYAAACMAQSEFDSRSQLAELSLPTLVIAGEQDGSTPPEVVRELADLIPRARYEEFSPAAHLLNVERATDFNKLVEEFLG